MYDNIFNNEDMIELQEILRKNNQSITTAESCTGGLIASMITEISGSSDIFNGAIVSYSNKIKSKELKVKESNLIKYGAVSKEVVSDMLDGAIEKFEADYAIAVSGIAGPNGGSEKKPVGTVVIGICSKTSKKVEICSFLGTRKEVQIQSAKKSLKFMLNFIKNS